ncbi:MAG: nucleotidyltransferase family protein [Paracoccaceae bacterium]
MTLAALLLAAGQSSRMRGTDKLMMPVQGQPCLRIMVKRLLDAQLPVFVTVPDLQHARNAALDGLDVIRVPVPTANHGMAHSLATGIMSLPSGSTASMVVPADMPSLKTSDFKRMVDEHKREPDLILRAATDDGKPGHPVIFPREFFDRLLQLTGDKGAQEVLRANPKRLRYVALPSDHATIDLDTPEDWEAWYT